MSAVANDFLRASLKRFREYKSLGEKTFAQLTEAEMHTAPNASSNSIAVIIRHMHGNMVSRWTNFLTEDGEKPSRRRDAEFEEAPASKQALLELWEEGWGVLLHSVESLEAANLAQTITIRSAPLTVVDAILRQLAHYSYHVGQIVYLGRWMRENEWQSLSIPKGASNAYNQEMKQSRH